MLNAATLSKVLAVPAVQAVVLKQLDAEISSATKTLAQLQADRAAVAGGEPAKPAKKASAAPAAPTRRKAKKGKKSSAAAAKPASRGPGRPKGSKNHRSGHTKAILDALGQYENGTAKAAEIRETCKEAGHEMASGIFHSTITALKNQGRVTKAGERSDAVYTLVPQTDDDAAEAAE
jgi:hypothetical protein